MQVVQLARLPILTTLVGLGWLAPVTIHAQAPAGPITAAPSQPAPATAANASNPAPLPPPPTTILGAWKFNPADNDDPNKKTQQPPGSYAGLRDWPRHLGCT